MKTQVFDIIASARTGDKTVNDATNEILKLFKVDIFYCWDKLVTDASESWDDFIPCESQCDKCRNENL